MFFSKNIFVVSVFLFFLDTTQAFWVAVATKAKLLFKSAWAACPASNI
jgi:hypothetical protein